MGKNWFFYAESFCCWSRLWALVVLCETFPCLVVPHPLLTVPPPPPHSQVRGGGGGGIGTAIVYHTIEIYYD